MPPERFGRFARRAAALSAAVFLAGLVVYASVQPLDEGYVRYAGIADAMVRSGDWVVPRLEGRVYLEKPPLFPWLVALPIAALGRVPSWCKHLPDVLAGLLAAGWIFAMGRRLFGRTEPALAAVLVTATSYRFLLTWHGERLDILFAALTAGAFYHFYVALEPTPAARPRAGSMAIAGAVGGLATLTKGPLALLFLVVCGTGYAFWTRRARALLARETALGLGVWLGVSLAWPALLVARLGWAETLAALHATDFVSRYGGPLHYLASVPSAFAPWSLLLPALGLVLWQRKPRVATDAGRFAAAWGIGMLAILHMTSAKHWRYLLPMYPAFGLFVVTLWYREGDGEPAALGRWTARLTDGALGLILAAAALTAVAVPVVLPWIPARLEPPWPGLVAADACAVAVAVLAALTFRAWHAGGDRRAVLWATGACLLLGLAGFDGARAARYAARPCFAEARSALAALPPNAPARSFGLNETRRLDAGFAAGRPLPNAGPSAALARWIADTASRQPAFVVTRSRDASAVSALSGVSTESVATFCLRGGERVLLRVRFRPPAP